jgi:hypothetical protein
MRLMVCQCKPVKPVSIPHAASPPLMDQEGRAVADWTIEQRHLVWMRAKRYGWRDITIRFACDRTTAWRRWQKALQTVTDRLNGERSGTSVEHYRTK